MSASRANVVISKDIKINKLNIANFGVSIG